LRIIAYLLNQTNQPSPMKKFLALMFVLLSFISCNSQNSEQTVNKNIELVKTYFDLFNKHDWYKLSELYSEEAEFKDPTLGKGSVSQNRKQFIKKYADLNTVFPDLKDEIIQIYPSGEKHVIVEFISTGTGEDNSKFELPICAIFTIENGHIVKDYSYFDNFDETE
jgi:ketosteroid isomerase-like protein